MQFLADLPDAEEENQHQERDDELAQNPAPRLARPYRRRRGNRDPGHRALHAHRDPVGLSPVCHLRRHIQLLAGNLARSMPWPVKPGTRSVYS